MIKLILLIVFGLLLLACLVFFLGPREKVQLEKVKRSFDFGADLDAWLVKSESVRDDIIPGLEKQIIWNDPASKEKTEYAVVYVHGFSASLQETRPLPDLVAKDLGANIFYTRLAGHGLELGDTSTGMGEPLVHDWLNDTVEALAIGRQIGEKVIVISASTGSTLLTHVLARPEHRGRVVANVFISPNYGVVNPASRIFTAPWAHYILPLVAGKRRIWEPRSDVEAKYWTWNYSVEALIRMGTSVKLAKRQKFEDMVTPTLFLYSELDDVVRHEETEQVIERWGAGKKVLVVNNSEDVNHHVIAGACKSPGTTEPLAQEILTWVRSL